MKAVPTAGALAGLNEYSAIEGNPLDILMADYLASEEFR
jgi:hypothetical protein